VRLNKHARSSGWFCVGAHDDSQDAKGIGSVRRNRTAISLLRVISLVLFLLAISSLCCYATNVVFIRSTEVTSLEQRQLEIATRFYGVDLDLVTLGAENIKPALSRLVERRETVAVAIAATALALVDQKVLLRSLKRKRGENVPVLILGVTPGTYTTLLKAWSGGATVGCKRLAGPLRPHYLIDRVEGFTRQLSDIDIPFSGVDAFYFVLGENGRAQQIMAIRADREVFPTFIKTAVGQVKVFLASTMPFSGDGADEENMVRAFAEIAPAMMFTRYGAGESGWHSLYHYANLTIDDPWLRRSYGYLDYRGLLTEMEKHDFHSTIAFIPWNYDRSEPTVVSLFRDHRDRFSISIHGDNHDHKEFADYRSKPLSAQTAALKQALARMDRFQRLTGISYDKVMVFPHSIAPEGTLEALKTNNYLATVNSFNIPTGRRNPSFLSVALRPVTVEYANFASIRRYPVEVPTPAGFIAMNNFLDNPILFYCHHDFFAGGIDAFDDVADQVNRLEPDTRWVSVGEIVKHLYLVKLRDDSGYDVLPFTSNFRLDNISGRNSSFYVKKPEAGPAAIRSVRVDGQDYPYSLRDGSLDLAIPIQAGKSRNVVIEYENDLNLGTIDISKSSVRVYLLRMASDLRDISLPRHAVGRALIAMYYKDGTTLAWTLACFSLLIAFCVLAALSLRKTIGRSSRMRRAGIRG
jgi:hypothetical protein